MAFRLGGFNSPGRGLLLIPLIFLQNTLSVSWKIYVRLGFLGIRLGERGEVPTFQQARFAKGEEINPLDKWKSLTLLLSSHGLALEFSISGRQGCVLA